MFNLFFSRYVPGFRVGPDGVPGFDIDDNGLPRRAIASFSGTLPDSASQQYPDAEQYPDAAPTQTSPSISFGLPGAASWVLPTPLPGFRVSPQGDVPGFNVGPQYGAPGFNVDENGDQQQETIWSDELSPGSVTPQDPNTTQTPIPPPDVDELGPASSAVASPLALPARDHAAAVADRIRIRAPSDPARSTRHLVRARQRHPVSTRDLLPAHLHNRWSSKRSGTFCCSDRRTSGRTPPRTEFCER